MRSPPTTRNIGARWGPRFGGCDDSIRSVRDTHLPPVFLCKCGFCGSCECSDVCAFADKSLRSRAEKSVGADT